jgi:hypothetical protein
MFSGCRICAEADVLEDVKSPNEERAILVD